MKLSKLSSIPIVTFCEKNGLADVEENDSNDNDATVCDDHDHKAVLCIFGYFF